MVLNECDLDGGSGEHKFAGVADSLLHRLEHDFGADVRTLTQLAMCVAEDADAAGVVLPDEIRRHISQLEHRGTLLRLFSAKLSSFRQIGRHNSFFSGDWDALWQFEDRELSVQLPSEDPTVPVIQTPDLLLLLSVLADTFHSNEVAVEKALCGTRVTFSCASDLIVRNMSRERANLPAPSSGLPHHVMLDGTLNAAILARIADEYAGEYVAHRMPVSTTVSLPLQLCAFSE